jgi:hypothetical protein
VSSLKDFRQADAQAHRRATDDERRTATAWLYQVVQLIPAPAGWRCVARSSDDGCWHEPMAAIGLSRSGQIQPISPRTDAGHDNDLSFCIDGMLYNACDSPAGGEPCPACAAERAAAQNGGAQ